MLQTNSGTKQSFHFKYPGELGLICYMCLDLSSFLSYKLAFGIWPKALESCSLCPFILHSCLYWVLITMTDGSQGPVPVSSSTL